MDFYNGGFCWLCSTPGSYCNCELSESDFAWSKSASQESFYTFNGRERVDADEPAFDTNDGNYFLADPFENTDLEVDNTIQCLERGSQQLYAVSTPKNNDVEKWESPGTMPPPESSSPVGLGSDSSPISTDPALPMLREDLRCVDRRFFCCARDNNARSHIKALYNDWVNFNAPIFPTTMSTSCPPLPPPTVKLLARPVPSVRTNMDTSIHVQGHPASTSGSSPSMPAVGAAQGPIAQRICANNKLRDMRDICAVKTRTTIEQDEIHHASGARGLMPASRKRALFSGPTILDLVIPIEPDPHSTGNDRPYDIGTTRDSETDRDEVVPSTTPYQGVSPISVSGPAQDMVNNRLKRRRSSVDPPPEAKKVKLDRTLSRVSCTSNASVQSRYQASEPASLRRARSLMSEASSCFEDSMVRWLPCYTRRRSSRRIYAYLSPRTRFSVLLLNFPRTRIAH